jgi:hypothetical protein
MLPLSLLASRLGATMADDATGISGGFLDATGAGTRPGNTGSIEHDDARVAAAIAIVADHVRFDRDAIAQAIRNVLSDGTVAGTGVGLRQIGSPQAVSAIEKTAQAVQWDGWHPGATETFPPLGGPATVVNVSVVVNEVIESAISRMGHVLSEGIADGRDDETLVASMRAMACDVLRSEVIARTETTAALSMAILSVYERHGLDQWNWHPEKNPCPACLARAESSPHFVGSPLLFPEHPNCRCIPTPHAWA